MSARRSAAVFAAVVVAGAVVFALGAEAVAEPSQTARDLDGASVPLVKLQKAVKARDAARAEVKALRATIRRGPDFEVSLQLAAIAYGQDWRHLHRCALSEGSRRAERFDRHNRRPNSAGSGAFSSFQFMRGTFLSTPYARLDWTRQDVQAHAAAWMFSVGRSREWTGTGC